MMFCAVLSATFRIFICIINGDHTQDRTVVLRFEACNASTHFNVILRLLLLFPYRDICWHKSPSASMCVICSGMLCGVGILSSSMADHVSTFMPLTVSLCKGVFICLVRRSISF